MEQNEDIKEIMSRYKVTRANTVFENGDKFSKKLDVYTDCIEDVRREIKEKYGCKSVSLNYSEVSETEEQ
jgi:hypothetical protein